MHTAPECGYPDGSPQTSVLVQRRLVWRIALVESHFDMLCSFRHDMATVSADSDTLCGRPCRLAENAPIRGKRAGTPVTVLPVRPINVIRSVQLHIFASFSM